MYEERIERYLANQMSAEEKEQFELQLQQDANLKSEFDKTQNALEDLRWHDRIELKSRLQNIEKSIKLENSGKSKIRMGWLGIGLLILLVIVWIWFRMNSKFDQATPGTIIPVNADSTSQSVPNVLPVETTSIKANELPSEIKPAHKKQKHTSEEIYAMVFEPYTDEELENQIRGGDEKTDYEIFCNLYYNERYAKALSTYENLSPEFKDDERVLLIKANAHLALNQLFPAISILERLIKNTGSSNKKEIYWYLGLAYLRLNRIDDAHKLFSNTELQSDPRSKKVLNAL
jgi:hypothetical protein